MSEKSFIYRKLTLALAGVFLVMASCSEPEKPKITKPAPQPVEEDDPTTDFVKFGNKLFSVPSPVEMAMLLTETHDGFSEELLSDAKASSAYTTKFQQAVNLGIYGADLGYALAYEQSQTSIGYLQSCKKLAAELGISGALYADLMKRFEEHMDNKDSLLSFMTETFRASDAYLQENESRDISTLILTGGWIESLYFATEVVKVVKHDALITRVGEQKNSLNNLITILSDHQDKPGFGDLIAQLKELEALFQDVEYQYTYAAPTIDTTRQLLVMNSSSSVNITPEQLEAISQKVKEIRKGLIG